jgi:hypothetical protein
MNERGQKIVDRSCTEKRGVEDGRTGGRGGGRKALIIDRAAYQAME